MMKIGDHIKALREGRGWSQRQLAAKANISNSTLSLYESNERTPSVEMLIKLSTALEADFNTMINLIKGNAEPDLDTYSQDDFYKIKGVIAIPLVGTVRAGRPILAIDNIEGHINIDRMMLTKNKEYYGLKIKGDSMDKLISDGSVAVIEKTEDVNDGDIAIVAINGDEATIKKIQFKGDGIILFPMSNNTSYEAKYYDIVADDVHILGKLVMSINRF